MRLRLKFHLDEPFAIPINYNYTSLIMYILSMLCNFNLLVTNLSELYMCEILGEHNDNSD